MAKLVKAGVTLRDQLNQKLVDSPYFTELEKDQAHHIYFRSVKTALDLFREENIAIEAEIKSNEKALLNIEAELKKTNELEKESGEIVEINDQIEATYSSKTMSDDEKLNKVQDLELQRLDKTLSLGKQFEDALKDPNKLKEKLNELLANIKIDNKISTYKGFEEMIGNKRSEIEAGTSSNRDGTDTSAQESINVYESVATRFSRLMNK
jgi:hypothetical protein